MRNARSKPPVTCTQRRHTRGTRGTEAYTTAAPGTMRGTQHAAPPSGRSEGAPPNSCLRAERAPRGHTSFLVIPQGRAPSTVTLSLCNTTSSSPASVRALQGARENGRTRDPNKPHPEPWTDGGRAPGQSVSPPAQSTGAAKRTSHSTTATPPGVQRMPRPMSTSVPTIILLGT